jgi:hypothetical protein
MNREINPVVFQRIAAQGMQDSVYRMTGRVMKPRKTFKAIVLTVLWLAALSALVAIPLKLRGHESAPIETHRL